VCFNERPNDLLVALGCRGELFISEARFVGIATRWFEIGSGSGSGYKSGRADDVCMINGRDQASPWAENCKQATIKLTCSEKPPLISRFLT
jgi:hypothetical protein